MNKEMWADIFESLANSIRTMGDPKIAEKIDAIEKWTTEKVFLIHNRVCDLEQKVEVLQSHRTAIAGLSTQIVELARRVTETEKRPMMDADLAAVFEITKRQVNELLQFRQGHSRHHYQESIDMERYWKKTESRLKELEGRTYVGRIEAVSNAGGSGDSIKDVLERQAGGGEGGV